MQCSLPTKLCNFKDPNPFCPKVFVPGCVCKTGMVRDPQKTCIYPQQCPLRNVTTKKPSSKVTVEKVYPPEQKYRRCDSYCPIPNRPRLRCPKMCYLGYRCRRQMFQKPKKDCSPPNRCLTKVGSPTYEVLHKVNRTRIALPAHPWHIRP
ncbi:hypothetical protein CDAR_80821 [Caerostris darwini]|uniref:TIL domain-containing protein n=1 Tax=Caerostris darwini TaxID=1538125 RepID=A0AAV4SAJ8_9ARAC|nr:hypothetical protein CDAR_80821 [Caerostris darwini]